MGSLFVLLIALIAIALAWKLLAGIVKTLALVAILIVAAVVVFGVLN